MNLNGQIFPLLIFQFEMMNMRGFCGWLTAMAVDEAILVNLIGFMMFEWKGAHQITFPPCQCRGIFDECDNIFKKSTLIN